MVESHATLLLAVTFVPLAGALAIVFGQLPGSGALSRWYALAVSVMSFALSLGLLGSMQAEPGTYGAYLSVPWMTEWGITFTLGVDGLSGLMVILTNLLMIVSVLASWTAIAERQKEFYAFLLVLQTGIVGTFLALDLFLFYVFWELMLVPLYFLIGIFGSERRIYATMKFFLYTMAGSVLMLIGILTLYIHAAPHLAGGATFRLEELLGVAAELPKGIQRFIFFTFALAFCIKAPLFPFHTWLPDAHTEAPTAGSIMLAGVLLKTGVYGLMRFAIPLFPGVAVESASLFIALAVIAIIFGALAAFAQKDMKRLVAYSSVSHMGFIILGLFSFEPEAVTGAALQMLNHGISTGALFFCVGVLYERRHTRLLSEFGGLAHNMKVYATLTVIVVLSSVGLPGLNGFVGEFMILLGSFAVHPWAVAIATLGVILAAVYLLRMVQLTFFGPLENEANKGLADLNAREVFSLLVLIFFAFWIGIYSKPYTEMLEPSAIDLHSRVTAAADRILEGGEPQEGPLEERIDAVGSAGQNLVRGARGGGLSQFH